MRSALPYGGGAWASRGISLGGEAALRAARRLRGNILTVAAALMQTEASALDLIDGAIIGPHGVANMDLSELATIVRFSPSTVPLAELPPFIVEDSFVPPSLPYLATNGVQAAHVELDAGTGLVKILDFWVVDDCGRIINPMLVDEQIRGGVVQGIGAALFEHCVYSTEGQLLNGTLADYLLPMASEMPDIQIEHVSTPTRESHLCAKGVGEAGTVGAIGAIWTAVNDAMRPLGAQATQQPLTPDHLIECFVAAESRSRAFHCLTESGGFPSGRFVIQNAVQVEASIG